MLKAHSNTVTRWKYTMMVIRLNPCAVICLRDLNPQRHPIMIFEYSADLLLNFLIDSRHVHDRFG